MKESQLQTKTPVTAPRWLAVHSYPASASQASIHPALQLQSLVGNQAGQRFIQAKLTVTQPNDPYEQEADRVADGIMRMTESDSRLEKGDGARAKTLAPQISRLVAQTGAHATPKISPSVDASIHALNGRGTPLPDTIRAFYEPRLGADLSAVRVHTDSTAAATAAAIHARAFTVGQNIAFGAAQYAPDSTEGKKLLGHELTHVVQQRGNIAIQRYCDPTKSSCLPPDTSVASPEAGGPGLNALFNQSFSKPQPTINPPGINPEDRRILLQMEFKPTLDLLLSENLQTQGRLQNYDRNAFGTGAGIGPYRRQWSITSLGSRTGILNELERSNTALNSTLNLVGLTDAAQITKIEDTFISKFRGKAKEIAFFMLDQSEIVTKSEYDRYTNMPVDQCPSVLPELRASAQRLANFQYELVNLMNSTAAIFNAQAPWGYPQGPTNITADDYYKYLGGSVFSSDRQVQSQLNNFKKAIQEEGLKFPVLMKERLNYIKLGYQMSDAQLKSSILGHTVEVMENIRESRRNIDDDNIWDLDPVIKAAIDLLGLKPGSYSHGYITKFLSDRKRNKTILDIFLSAVGVLLAIVAVFATGGLAAFAIVGGATVGGYQTYQHLKEYNFQTAARGSAFDLDKSIGAHFDPSYLSVVFDVAMTIVGFAQAASALRGIRAASQAASVLGKEATALERVAASAGDLGLEANVTRFANAKGFIAEKVSDDVIRITHPQMEGEFILTRQSLRFQTPTGTGGMRSEFEIPFIQGSRPTKPPALQAPDADIDAAFARLASGEGPDKAAMLGDLMFHSQRREAIDELRRQLGNLPGRPGRTPPGVAVNPQPGFQSAHTTAQSALRNLPTYDPGEMITRFLPTGRGHAHTVFDQHWQAQFRAIHNATGRTTTTAQELAEVTARAARQSGAFLPDEAESMAQLVINDLFFQLRLAPSQPLRMPGM